MDFISTSLVSLKAPSGFWESILNSFKGATGTYILAVILLAVIIRLLFSVVDIVNKRVSAKNSNIQAKMQPELDAVKKRYANDPKMLQQKTSEVYKKYQFNMIGSCLPMLIIMILQFTVFLTLWNSLRDVANYNIAVQYQNMKEIYSTAISLNDEETITNAIQDGYEVQFEIDEKENQLKVNLTKKSEEENQDNENIPVNNIDFKNLDNEEIYSLLQKYVIEKVTDENGEEVDSTVYLKEKAEISKKINEQAQKLVEQYYKDTQESFMWIKNIYKAEAPSSPFYTENEIKNILAGIKDYYSDEEKILEKDNDFEGEIFKQIKLSINEKALGVNGYYILTIIAVLTSVLSLWLSNFLMRSKGTKQKQPWLMYVIMPLIFGLFTFSYTSLFAVYIIVGQLMMILLTPLTTLIVKKWNKTDEKKKKEKNIIDVDYRRKDV